VDRQAASFNPIARQQVVAERAPEWLRLMT